jgi:protein-S-isoprenylcysteine O-methyltransferase Ste14
MSPSEGFRVWFLALYALGILLFLSGVIRFRGHRGTIERQIGPLPTPGILVPFGIPILILLTRVGEVQGGWLPVRAIGLALGLYFLVMTLWAVRTLKRLAVPGIGIFRDHTLVTSGPFRLVRHPIYSGGLALMLGAALGTLNWLLGVLVFLVALVMQKLVRAEEGILRAKFATTYDDYARRTRRFVPRP